MDKLFTIKDRVAVITGATGVLCAEMAREMARRGARVVVMSTAQERADNLTEKIRSEGGTALGVAVDVLDKDSLIRARERIVETFGRIDILINGAGGNHKSATVSPDFSFFDIPADALQWVFNLNVLGTVLATQVFGEVMVKQARKHNQYFLHELLSALTNIAAYSAAKASINNFTQWMVFTSIIIILPTFVSMQLLRASSIPVRTISCL